MTPSRYQTVSCRVKRDTVKQFEEVFPMDGAKSYFVRTCMEKAIELYERGEIQDHDDVMEEVVRRVTE